MQKLLFFAVFFVAFHINESIAKPCQRHDPYCLPEPCGQVDYCPWSMGFNDNAYRSTIIRAMMPKNQEKNISTVKVGLVSKFKKKKEEQCYPKIFKNDDRFKD